MPLSDLIERLEGAEGAVYDKTGREIMQGDVLKVFHYVGARRKHHYMYKQVVGERKLGKSQNAYWFVSHLDQTDDGYHLAKDGRVYDDYEIVQSVDAKFEDRPRLAICRAKQEASDA